MREVVVGENGQDERGSEDRHREDCLNIRPIAMYLRMFAPGRRPFLGSSGPVVQAHQEERPLPVKSVQATSSEPFLPVRLCELPESLTSLASDLLHARIYLLPVSFRDPDVQLWHVCGHLRRQTEL